MQFSCHTIAVIILCSSQGRDLHICTGNVNECHIIDRKCIKPISISKLNLDDTLDERLHCAVSVHNEKECKIWAVVA